LPLPPGVIGFVPPIDPVVPPSPKPLFDGVRVSAKFEVPFDPHAAHAPAIKQRPRREATFRILRYLQSPRAGAMSVCALAAL
jgi:hypothetical protein